MNSMKNDQNEVAMSAEGEKTMPAIKRLGYHCMHTWHQWAGIRPQQTMVVKGCTQVQPTSLPKPSYLSLNNTPLRKQFIRHISKIRAHG